MNLLLNTVSYESVDVSSLEPFQTELELVDEFERLFDVFLGNGIHLEREFDCGFGIADAVIFKYKKNQSLLNLGKVDPEWAYTLKSLPYRRNFNIEYLCQLAGSSQASAKKAINNFIKAGYCTAKDKNTFIKNKQPRELCNSMIAIEAKLKNWKRALWQASRYKTFASESWVVLDRRYATSAIKHIETFKKFNIGLATFSTDGSYDEHFSPKKDTHQSEIAYWKANTILAQKLLSQ